jgi:hypothetical protein
MGSLNGGQKIPDGDMTWMVFRVSTGGKQVKIGSANTGFDPGSKFRNKRYTFRWDGTGYKRQGQYLRPDGIY